MTSLFKLLLLSSFNNSNAFYSSPQQHLLNYSPKILFAENPTPRRTFLTKTSLILPSFLSTQPAKADDFELIATRAAAASPFVSHSKDVASLEDASRQSELARQLKEDMRSIYDFDLPVNGKSRAVGDLIGEAKAILVVNIKQDDPLARKNIPELIALVDRFGKNGEFAVIISPTDQGYYEPDTSALIRLKLASEYGYGTNPAAILTDKVNLLGSGALPFWRWLEGSCRTPAGLGKIQANFEKFLVDGNTGRPIRRYPRKYQPYDIADDILALIHGKPLPPAQNNFKEEWRNAAKEAENDTYRFQKGLNYFDQ